MTETITNRIERVQARIEAACLEAGRDPSEVLLIGVSKRQPLERVLAAVNAGVLDLGENYAQALAERRVQLPDPAVRWHFIGHLQRNKVKLVVPCALIHSVDSVRLVQAIGKRARALGVVQDVLVEVSTGEASKAGVPEEGLAEVLEAAGAEEGVRPMGLMAMSRLGSSLDEARGWFEHVRGLASDLSARLGLPLPWLSMGMSGDLEAAILAGATHVRVGEALFGPRER